MMDSVSISVVIPVLDGGRLFGELLEALRDQKNAPSEIVVVDSGSSDGSLEVAKEHGAQIIQITPGEFDHGATRNLGIENTTGEIVVLLTQDATPASPEFLGSIASPFADPEIAGVYGRQIPRPDCDVVTARNLHHWKTGRRESDRVNLRGCDLESLSPMERYELCVFDSVCCALRRNRWEELPYEPAAFGEDVTWGRAALMRGWSIAYEPDAAVIHSHRRSVGYEYGRMRQCHELLHQLFGVATLPRVREIPAACLWNLRHDLPYVWAEAPRGSERFRQLARVAAMSVVGPIAQYLGIRDAQRAARMGSRLDGTDE
jgi:rhamnosyltransferase